MSACATKSQRILRVLFIHGLESGPNGYKATVLRSDPSLVVCAVFMPHTKNVWQSCLLQREAVMTFKPDVIVGSSYGAIVTLVLVWCGVWRGPCLLISSMPPPPFFSFLPGNGPYLFVHGTMDSLFPIALIRDFVKKYNNNANISVSLLEFEDTHPLNSLSAPRDSGTDTRPMLLALVHKMALSLKQDVTKDTHEHTTQQDQSSIFSTVRFVVLVFVAFVVVLCVHVLRTTTRWKRR